MPDSGALFAGTTANVAFGGTTWSNTDNAKTTDGTFATCADPATSDILKLTNYGFSISSTATIVGITASNLRKSSTNTGNNFITDNTIQLYVGGSLSGDNKADLVTHWPTTLTAKSYGGALDVWGTSLTPSQANSSDFGIGIAFDTNQDNGTGSVDSTSITITYNESSTGRGFFMRVMFMAFPILRRRKQTRVLSPIFI